MSEQETPTGKGERMAAARVAVLGAGGSAGAAIVPACLEAGHDVIAVTRSGSSGAEPTDSLTHRGADLADPAATRTAVSGADAVVFAANIPYQRWTTELPRLVDNAADAAAAIGARFVMIDNLYMYSPAAGPINERAAEHASDTKGALRGEIGRRLLERHRTGELSVVIARATDFYGPHATNSGLYMTGIKPGVAAKRMRGVFDLDQPHSFVYLPDVGRALVHLIEHPDADGRVWILPATAVATQREMLEAVNDQLPRRVKVGLLSSTVIRLAGLFSPLLREFRSVEPQFARPWVVDSADFDRRFACATTDTTVALRTTIESFMSSSHDAASTSVGGA